MAQERNHDYEPLTKKGVQVEVELIIEKGLEEIRRELARHFSRRNNETTGHYISLLSEVNKESGELIERMLKIKF